MHVDRQYMLTSIGEDVENWNCYRLLLGTEISTASIESRVGFPKKLKVEICLTPYCSGD